VTTDASLKMLGPVTAIDALINDTPVAAIMIPAVIDWAKRFRRQESKLLIPVELRCAPGGNMHGALSVSIQLRGP
jgi:hypothetical protein